MPTGAINSWSLLNWALDEFSGVSMDQKERTRKKNMQTYKLVMPGDLNHYGFLFGGNLLKWVDEIAWIAATMYFPGMNFVTVAIDNVEFKKSVRQGAILRFESTLQRKGQTSVQFQVEVFRNSPHEKVNQEAVFSTVVTMVRVDSDGNKMSLSEPADCTDSDVQE